MPLIQQDVPNRLSDLALYASMVATGVIALNLALVKIARWVTFHRSRPRSAYRLRAPHR